jgi:hypothetical protein
MQTANGKPRPESARSREARERIAQWRQIASKLSRRHPTWSALQIAREIQRSEAGRKRGGVLTYSIGNIARNIYDAIDREEHSVAIRTVSGQPGKGSRNPELPSARTAQGRD